MSRGGRGGGRGGRRGPDLAWDDEESPPTPTSHKPEPLFPPIHIPTPKPLNHSELSSVKNYLRIRDRIRNSNFYAVLEPSSLTDGKGKVDKRAGFDPFNDQEKYSSRHYQKRRTVPDFDGRECELKFFPRELWPVVDPRHKHPLWKTVGGDPASRTRKRKRTIINPEEEEQANKEAASDSDSSDVQVFGRRKTDEAKSRRDDPTTKQAKQKRGLDAEDDYPDVDQNDDDDAEGEEELQDSEFEESEDGEGDDYNAEIYFDTGEGDEDDGGGGDDEGQY